MAKTNITNKSGFHEPLNRSERGIGTVVGHVFKYSDFAASGDVLYTDIPAKTLIKNVYVIIDTAFNAATTNNMLITNTTRGTIDFTAINPTKTGVTHISLNEHNTVETPVNIEYNFTGTAPSTGEGRIIIEYISLQN